MLVKRQIKNCLNQVVSTNLIKVTSCKNLKQFCTKHNGTMNEDGKSFSVIVGPPLNRVTTTYSLTK